MRALKAEAGEPSSFRLSVLADRRAPGGFRYLQDRVADRLV